MSGIAINDTTQSLGASQSRASADEHVLGSVWIIGKLVLLLILALHPIRRWRLTRREKLATDTTKGDPNGE